MEKSIYLNYQIVGASNMVRFCSTILGSRAIKNKNVNNGSSTINLCISGQRIRNLEVRLRREHKKLSSHIIICIGTNDVLRMNPVRNFKKSVNKINKILRGKKVVWLTIPPILKLQHSELHNKRIQQFNKVIAKLAKIPNSAVIDLYQFCHNKNGNIREELFSKFYIRPRNKAHLPCREDGIHFNIVGLRKIAMWLKRILLPV